MSSWWGPTWISVRCGGKSEWTSSPVGLAQTRAQTKPPASASPTPPCQVKTAQSEAQRGRKEASMPSQANSVSLLPSFDWLNHAEATCDQELSYFSTCLPIKDRWHQLAHPRLMTRCFSRGLHLFVLLHSTGEAAETNLAAALWLCSSKEAVVLHLYRAENRICIQKSTDLQFLAFSCCSD